MLLSSPSLPRAAILAVLLTTGLALADPSPQDVAASRTLFDEGRKLMKAGKFAEACPKLEEGVRLNPGIGMRFNLAECYENLGKTASAWALYLDVAAAAKQKKEFPREKEARARAAKLEPKVSHLAVVVTAEVPGLEISRDGSVIGKGQFGTAVSLDPGTYTFTAKAPGHEPWEQKVTLGPDGATLTVTVPALVEKKKPAVVVAPPTPPPPTGLGGKRIVAIGAAAVGLVGVGLGTYFGLHAIRLNDSSAPHCEGNACNGEGYTLRTDARIAGNVSTVAFVVGALGLGTGVALWVLGAPGTSEPKASVTLAPGLAFVGVGGRW
ncbi:MAG: PEGA domain-containing protein [Myxococcales bacterium]|nr:PEGA domain-containing protein [Myxococcales bacterium]